MIAVLILAAILGSAGRLVWHWADRQNARTWGQYPETERTTP